MHRLMHRLLIALAVLAAAPAVAQERERLSSDDIEVRTVLSFKVSDTALLKILPPGWEINSPTAGQGKGFNLSIALVNQTAPQDPDGAPLPARNFVALVTPARKTGSDLIATMVLGGFMPREDAPGPYGLYEPAKLTLERRQHSRPDGKSSIEEDWEATGDDGNAVKVQVGFALGVPTRMRLEGRVRSAANPDFFRINRFEQAVDIVYSIPNGIDRMTKLSVSAKGPKLAPLFDGSEQLISITSIPYYSRSIYLPIP